METRRSRLTPSGIVSSAARAKRTAEGTGRPPMVKVGARETGFTGKVNEAAARGDSWLLRMGMAGYKIDEVAIMLPEDATQASDWLNCMMARVGTEGVTYFNRSVSKVQVHSLPSQYDVTYHFFTTAVKGVRLELMRLGNGHSPLHALYNLREGSRGRDACIVHASFKVGTEEEYRTVLGHLVHEGWSCGQDCSSDYGLFSYWRQPGDKESMLWLKPRVNLRDEKPLLFSPEDQGTEFQYPNFDAEQAEDGVPVLPIDADALDAEGWDEEDEEDEHV